MARTRYSYRGYVLRVYGVEHSKNFILKLPQKLFYLATRNTQRVPLPVIKIRLWIWEAFRGQSRIISLWLNIQWKYLGDSQE